MNIPNGGLREWSKLGGPIEVAEAGDRQPAGLEPAPVRKTQTSGASAGPPTSGRMPSWLTCRVLLFLLFFLMSDIWLGMENSTVTRPF